MKRLLLWLLMVVVFVALLLGGTLGAFYYMAGQKDLPEESVSFGGIALENAGYEWDVPILGGVVYKHFYSPATLSEQKLGDFGDTRPELELPAWVSQADMTLTGPDGTTVFQGSAGDYADFVYTANGQYTMSLTLHQLSEEKPAKPLGWYLYQANYTVNFQPEVTLSSQRATQGDVVAVMLTGIVGEGRPEAETDLGDVWFRPIAGGWMGYIPVTYNTSGGKHDIIVRCGETELSVELTVGAAQYGNMVSEPSQPASAAGSEQYRNAIWPLYQTSEEGKLWSGAFQAPSQGGVAVNYGTIYIVDGTRDGQSTGLTYAAPNGSDVFAPQAGKVVYAGTLEVSGGTVVIDHGCGVKSYLFGLGKVTAQKGQTVAAGDVVGKATDQHDLIYEVRIGNKSVDPAKILSGKSGLQYKENL